MTASDLPDLLERCESGDVTDLEALELSANLGFSDHARASLYMALQGPQISRLGYALAFFEAVLPGCNIEIFIGGDGKCCSVKIQPLGIARPVAALRDDRQVALTIICATLKAVIAKGESDANS